MSTGLTSMNRLGRLRLAVVAATTLMISGLAGGYLAGSASAESPVAKDVREQPLVAGTPCTATAKACVDLEIQKAWLLKDGKIIRGPVAISSGGNGKETPVGHSLRVYLKDKDHKSQESKLPNGQPAPMPFSVFFADGGIAFHSGSPSRSSAGCIHLGAADAVAWFNYLQIGDQVQAVKGSQERAARAGKASPAAAVSGKSDKPDSGKKDSGKKDKHKGDKDKRESKKGD